MLRTRQESPRPYTVQRTTGTARESTL